MATTPIIDFTARDFDTNVQALQEFVRTTNPDKWNSFFPGDLGQTLLELVAYDNSIQAYTIDKVAAEMFVGSLESSQSFVNLALLNGYQIKRATPAQLLGQIELAQVQATKLTIPDRFQIRDSNGLSWETQGSTNIEAGSLYPRQTIISFGDLKNQAVSCYLKIAKGTSFAVLVSFDGTRVPSDVNFPQLVSPGSVLVLTGQKISTQLGPAPDQTRSQFAIVEVGKLVGDLYDRAVLYLDRPWDLDDFIGTWTIENRSIQLIQQASQLDQETVTAQDRAYYQFTSSATGVVGNSQLSYLPSGSLDTLEQSTSAATVLVNGIPWFETKSLALSGPGDRVYELSFDGDDRVMIRFGDGIHGSLLPSGARLSVGYKTTDGVKGNVLRSDFQTSFDYNSASIQITNPYTRGTGGADKESLEQAKAGMIRAIRANDRGVSAEDYESLARQFRDSHAGSASMAKAVRITNLVPRENNLIGLYLWARTASGQLTTTSDAFKRSLLEFLTPRKMINDEPLLLDGKLQSIPIHCRYRYLPGADSTQELVRSAINTVLANLAPGDPLRYSDVIGAIEQIPGVDYTHLYLPDDDLPGSSDQAFVNSLSIGNQTTLSQVAGYGQTTIFVTQPDILTVGGRLMIVEPSRHPTLSTIIGITGNLVTLRDTEPVMANYTTDARVFNTDLWLVGWDVERPVEIQVQFSTGLGIEGTEMARLIAKRLRDYIDQDLMPGEALTRARLNRIIGQVINVTSSSVTFRGYEGDVNSFASEKITIKTLQLNGRSY